MGDEEDGVSEPCPPPPQPGSLVRLEILSKATDRMSDEETGILPRAALGTYAEGGWVDVRPVPTLLGMGTL